MRHNSCCCFYPWSCLGLEKWSCREGGAGTTRIYGRGDNSQHFPLGSKGDSVLGRARRPQKTESSPSDPIQVTLLPNEALIKPSLTKVPSCEGVQHPQQGISGHSWSCVIKGISVIQRRKQRVQTIQVSLHTPQLLSSTFQGS